MPHMIGEAGIMALCYVSLVVLSVVYPVVAFQAGEQAGVDTRMETGVVTRVIFTDFRAWLPEATRNNSQLQVPNLKSHKVTLPNRQTLATGFCSGKDISIAQSSSGFSGGGIPEFNVEILNNCYSGCPLSNIHLYCGEFASAERVNPNTFNRIADNDCLLNGGRGVQQGTLIAFTYANSFRYPLSFKSATFC